MTAPHKYIDRSAHTGQPLPPGVRRASSTHGQEGRYPSTSAGAQLLQARVSGSDIFGGGGRSLRANVCRTWRSTGTQPTSRPAPSASDVQWSGRRGHHDEDG